MLLAQTPKESLYFIKVGNSGKMLKFDLLATISSKQSSSPIVLVQP